MKQGKHREKKTDDTSEEKEEDVTPESSEHQTEPENSGLREMKPSIDDRIKQLKDEGKTPEEIVLILYEEEYSTHEIMKRHLPLKALKSMKERPEETDIGLIAGPVKGAGALQEFKELIRMEISKTRELSEAFYTLGLGALMASLSKCDMSMDEFRKIAHDQGQLKEAFKKAGETVFKALEYYQSDLITKVEAERDEARAVLSITEANVEELKRRLDPKLRMEKMIYNIVLLSGSVQVDPAALDKLLQTYIGLEVTAA